MFALFYLLLLTPSVFGEYILPEDLSIVYGNLRMRTLSPRPNGQDESLAKELCRDGRPIYIDYAPNFNSRVIVCSKSNVELVTIKINDSLPQSFKTTKLELLATPLGSSNMMVFALDWITGLFYFNQAGQIHVTHLNKSENAVMLYGSKDSSSTITGLVVRPELSELYWTEYSNDDRHTDIYRATQSGKNVTLLHREHRQQLERLSYDYVGGHFMVLKTQTYTEDVREAYIFEQKGSFEMNTKDYHNINYTNAIIHNVQLHDQAIVVSLFVNNSMHEKSNLSNSKRLIAYDYHQRYQTIVDLDIQFDKEFHFYFYDPVGRVRPNQSEDRCSHTDCIHDWKDFCIPNTLDTYVCRYNIEHVQWNHEPKHWLADNFLYIATLAACSLLFIVLVIILVNRKRMSFYQIRLRKVQRVSSTKLEAKPAATLEIAD